MVELVDALDSKINGSNALRVRVSSPTNKMDISKTNSLVELFFDRLEKIEKEIFFNLVKTDYQFSWEKFLKKYLWFPIKLNL